MELTDGIGTFAAVMTTFSFLPQTIKTLKSGQTAGISVWMYGIFLTGISFWLLYGLMKNDWIITLANTLTFFFALPVLLLAVRNRNKHL